MSEYLQITRQTVSVIIPTYNSAPTLPEAIQSVLAQTRPADEIIVVDDASSDATAAVCGTFRNRVRYIRHATNLRASAARNTGIVESRGEWLAFLDADDVWEPNKLEKQLEAIQSAAQGSRQTDRDESSQFAPEGPRENSPAIHCWDGKASTRHSPVGTAEHFNRPQGTTHPDRQRDPAINRWAIFKGPYGTTTPADHSQEQYPAFCVTAANVWSPHDRAWHILKWTGPLEREALQSELLIRNIFTGLCSSILVRRSAIESIGGFAVGRGCEDRRLAIELLSEFRPVVLTEPLIRQKPGPAHWTDPKRQRRAMLRMILDYDRLFHELDPTGRLKCRALARVNERTGMHYLENGDLRNASRALARAAWQNPFLPNPWRVLINACTGRLRAGPRH